MSNPVTEVFPKSSRPAAGPRIIGIVNITEDSFSDGGRYLDPAAALAHARELRAEGADIIELGPAASHPGSAPVSAAEERRRLAPVLERLVADGIPVSVDSFLPETLRLAVSEGAAYLNDIHGFGDASLFPILAASQCRLIVMHAVQASGIATRVVTDPATVWAGICQFFTGRLAALEAAGISRSRLIIDPGLGYFLGRTPAPSLAVLARISELKDTFGLPVLVSPSRKSFLRAVTGRELAQSGSATLAAEVFAALQGAEYVRTHDAAAACDAFAVLAAIRRESTASGNPTRAPEGAAQP
jgi:dihydropteroate synthase type 2